MANSKHLEILMYGVAAWNDWRKENSDIIPDLSHADLRWAYLSEADFSGANLSNAKLSGANLSNADLCRANLSKCTLRDANLKQTNISDANFGKAEFFSKANLNGANLGGANLSRVDLSGASLKNTCLAGAQIEDTNFNNADWGKGNGEHILKLLKAILKRAEEGIVEWNNWREENPHIKPDLREVFLYEANLSGANFSMTNLSNANLRNADLSMTNLSKANLRRTNLRGANLSKAHLGNVCLLNAQIEGANFNNTIWDGGNGEHILKLIMAISKGEEGIVEWNKWRNKKRNIMPNLRGANLSRAKLNRVNLSGADLRGTNLSGIDLSGAKLKGAISDDSHLIDFLLRIFTFNEGRDELGKFMERIEEERDVSTRNKFIERLSKHLITLSESKLSVSHPKLLSKKFKSRIMMSFFSERLKKNFLERLEEELSQSEYSFKDYKHIFEKTGITPGSKIVIELNHHIHVSEKVTLVVDRKSVV